MLYDEIGHSTSRRWRTLAVSVVVVSCGAAICLAWSYHRLALAKEKDALLRSLVESASTVDENSPRIQVALFEIDSNHGDPVDELKRMLDSESSFAWESVSSIDIRNGNLERFDVVLFPGGSSRRQNEALGNDGVEAVKKFVQSGGGYVGICGGAFLATAKYQWGLALVNAKPLTGKIDIPDGRTVSIAARGKCKVNVALTDAGRFVFGNSPDHFEIMYTGGPILSPADLVDLPEYVSLGTFATEVWVHESQQGTMINTPAIIAGRFGAGHVILFGPHPEMTSGLEFLIRQSVLATRRAGSDE